MTCKDCVHCDACNYWLRKERRFLEAVDGFICEHFKDKSCIIEFSETYNPGDVCIYGFHSKNKSLSIVEIVRLLNDERGVAEIKFIKVIVDDTGNGYFNYLMQTGKTMNASLKYLKNITPTSTLEQEAKQ